MHWERSRPAERSCRCRKSCSRSQPLGAAPTTIEISGNLGSEQLSFAASAQNSAVTVAVNQLRDSTGVSAIVVGGHLKLTSTDYGSSQFVSVKTISGSFVDGKSSGADAKVNINGAQAD